MNHYTEEEFEDFMHGVWVASLSAAGLLNDDPKVRTPFNSKNLPEIPENKSEIKELRENAKKFLSFTATMLRCDSVTFRRAGELFLYAINGDGLAFRVGDPLFGQACQEFADIYPGFDFDKDLILPEIPKAEDNSEEWQWDTIYSYLAMGIAKGWKPMKPTTDFDPHGECAGLWEDSEAYEFAVQMREEPYVAWMAWPGCLDQSGHSRGATMKEALHNLLCFLCMASDMSEPKDCTEASYAEWLGNLPAEDDSE